MTFSQTKSMPRDASARRIAIVDIARTAALLGMILFHLVFDLAMFGFLPADTARSAGWPLFSKLVAGSFLGLAGLSLYLAHGTRFRPRAYLKRLIRVVAAALLITAATYLAQPDFYVYFGILHSIAAASVIGLAFLRAPAVVTLAAAVAAFALPGIFDARGWSIDWPVSLGLSQQIQPAMDFEPVFPWIAPFLIGMALGRIGQHTGIWETLASVTSDENRLVRMAAWPGRHSLAVYLVHQPILIGLLQAWMLVAPA